MEFVQKVALVKIMNPDFEVWPFSGEGWLLCICSQISLLVPSCALPHDEAAGGARTINKLYPDKISKYPHNNLSNFSTDETERGGKLAIFGPSDVTD